MKRYSLILVSCICMLSCRKSLHTTNEHTDIRAYLHEHLSEKDFNQVDFSRVQHLDGDQFYKIGFVNKDYQRQFILLKHKDGTLLEGKIIEVSIDEAPELNLNGNISRFSLDRSVQEHQMIRNGFAVQSDANQTARETSEDTDQINMPMLLMLHTTEGPIRPYTIMQYINIQRVYNSIPNNPGYIYHYSAPEQKNETNDGGYSPPRTIVIQNDNASRFSLDIQKIIDCFNTIQDQGAVCTIELYADIPVDTDPQILVRWQQTSPGHAFIKLTKANQGKKAVQNIGLYPQHGFKSILTTAPVPGVLADDSQHEYNAAIKMTIDFERLSQVFFVMKKFSRILKYDIDEYNCTDFALAMFNVARPDNPLVIPRYQIPGGMTLNGSNTPQGLYLELEKRKMYGPERNNIEVIDTKRHSISTDLPCK